MVSGTRALLGYFEIKVDGVQGSGPEGVNDLCFHTYGEFSLSPPSPPPPPHPPPPGIGPFG